MRPAGRLASGIVLAAGLALAVVPAQAALECGDSISADKRLHNDLECDGAATGLDIEGDDITLDLNGHTISAEPNAATATGVFVGHGQDNKVTGGRIRGFDVGVAAGESTRATISGLDVRAEAAQVTVSESVGTRVSNNLLRDGSGSAVLVDGQFTTDVKVLGNEVRGGEIDLNEVEGVLVADNLVRNSDGAGISVANVDQAVVRDNHVDGAAQAGIGIGAAAAQVRVRDNEVDETEGGGILTSSGAGPVKAISNTVLDVNFNGFFVGGGTEVTLRRNVAKGSQGGDGIHVEDDDTLIEDNRVIENDQHGIESSSANGSGNVAKRNGIHPQCMPASLC